MQDPYFRNFWIKLDNGQELYPQLITNTKSGNPRYQVYEPGANVQTDEPAEIEDPIHAIRLFIQEGKGLRFGRDGEDPTAYEPDDRRIAVHGMDDQLRIQLSSEGAPSSDTPRT